jgi:hypothetical protein
MVMEKVANLLAAHSGSETVCKDLNLAVYGVIALLAFVTYLGTLLCSAALSLQPIQIKVFTNSFSN